MENQQNHLRNGTSESRRRNLAKCADVLGEYFQKWSKVFPNQPTGAAALAVYLEALSDLSPEQIEDGCAEATKTAEQFPKPGHIRHAVPFDRSVFMGPPQIEYPPVTDEERAAGLEFSKALREVIHKKQKANPSVKTATVSLRTLQRKWAKVPQSQLTVEQQKEILRKKGLL